MNQDRVQHGRGNPDPSTRLIAAVTAYRGELGATMAEIERRGAERASLESALDRAREEYERPAPPTFVSRIFGPLVFLGALGAILGFWFIATR